MFEEASMSVATSFHDDNSPEEQSRRIFLARATVAVGGAIGLFLTVPLAGSLVPESIVRGDAGKGVWADVPPAEFLQLKSASTDPVKINFHFEYADGYFPPADFHEFVWGIALNPESESKFKAARPELFETGPASVAYPVINMGFVVFSSVCPHLGCRVNWFPDQKQFVCPCHGSKYTFEGKKTYGPAPRGLDPLPLREKDGDAQITWIQYKGSEPDRVIVGYS
jgi:Rieske Fe-S protein